MSTVHDFEILSRLRRERSRSKFLRASLAAVAALIALAWILAACEWRSFDFASRTSKVMRFAQELVPYALRERAFSWSEYGAWIADRWQTSAAAATVNTLAIAFTAIVIAALFGAFASTAATRSLMTAEPYLPAAHPTSRWLRWGWSAVANLTRLLLLFLRAIPEYVFAFLAVAMLGPLAWALILALALHNVGILGRLGAEMFEDQPRSTPRALRAAGASRAHIAAAVLLPTSFTRFWLFFFYRFETCIREATVLGMVGVVSLGYGIANARARLFYDEMIFLIACSALLVLCGDLASTWMRERLRAASRESLR